MGRSVKCSNTGENNNDSDNMKLIIKDLPSDTSAKAIRMLRSAET